MTRPHAFLTAEWNKLLVMNFVVPTDVVDRLAPPGTEPDLFDGRSYASVVGFLFRQGRLFGFRMPGRGVFEEVNLRFYVRRWEAGEVRRGVVFVQEIAPRWLVATVANWLYNQKYVTLPMGCDHSPDSRGVAEGDAIGYQWQTGRGVHPRRNRMAARAAAAVRPPTPGSLEEFIIDHVWAYGPGATAPPANTGSSARLGRSRRHATWCGTATRRQPTIRRSHRTWPRSRR